MRLTATNSNGWNVEYLTEKGWVVQDYIGGPFITKEEADDMKNYLQLVNKGRVEFRVYEALRLHPSYEVLKK